MASIDVFWIFMLDYAKNWAIRRHSHDFYQLYYITSGSGTMDLDGNILSLTPGVSVMIRPNQAHELFEIQAGVLRMIDVKFYLHDEMLAEKLQEISQIQHSESELYDLLSKVRAEWKSALPFRKNMADILLEQCLYILIRTYVKAEESKFLFPQLHEKIKNLDGLSKEIADYIGRNCCTALSLDAMAQELTYNRNYLCKVFKQAAGITIINYANYLRISRAIDLIRYTNEKISDISENTGFHDIHYFAKVFKKITGHTPGELRDRQKYDMYTDIVEHGTFTYRYYHNPENPAHP